MLSARRLSVLVAVVVALVAAGGAAGHLGGIDPGQQFFDSEPPPEPAGMVAVVDVSETARVRADNPFQIAATIENTYGDERTTAVALKVDATGDGGLATTVAVQNVTMAGGESSDVTFTVPAETFDAGTYTYGVVAGAVDAPPNVTSDVTVNRPPTFRVSETTTVETVVAGEDATVQATVENVGDYAGTHRARLGVDADRDGAVRSDEVETARVVTVDGNASSDVEFTVPTDGLAPGRYDYHVRTDDGSAEGTLVVEQPAAFSIDSIEGRTDVTRSEAVNVSVTVTNEGDVEGSQTVSVTGANGTANATREVTVASGASTTVGFTVNTTDLTQGNYTVDVSAGEDNASVPIRVREGHFAVTDLDGTETIAIGDDLSFAATVTNVGDANDTQAVEYKIDVNDNDVPESYGITRDVTLAPGESTTVTFDVPYSQNADSETPFGALRPGAYVYGVYSDDAIVTDVFAAKWGSSGGRSGGGGGGGSAGAEAASRDEISQQKYGRYYDRLSGETQRQVDELYLRQPFADGLVVTEVLTREEIARQKYGLDVERGDDFEFDAIDVETQQEIEADFDAQFESEEGDRIESWDELARERYGTEYDRLAAEQQQTVRETYRGQF